MTDWNRIIYGFPLSLVRQQNMEGSCLNGRRSLANILAGYMMVLFQPVSELPESCCWGDPTIKRVILNDVNPGLINP
jgi:hypothetical protein